MSQLLEVELFRDCLSRYELVGRYQYWSMRARAGMVFSHSRVEVRRISKCLFSKVDKLCTNPEYVDYFVGLVPDMGQTAAKPFFVRSTRRSMISIDNASGGGNIHRNATDLNVLRHAEAG
jgi:hypothetical protein